MTRLFLRLAAPLPAEHIPELLPIGLGAEFLATDSGDSLYGGASLNRGAAREPVGNDVLILAECAGEFAQPSGTVNSEAHSGVLLFGRLVHTHKYTLCVSFCQTFCALTGVSHVACIWM